jgi:hypothetical protein
LTEWQGHGLNRLFPRDGIMQAVNSLFFGTVPQRETALSGGRLLCEEAAGG